MRDDGGKYTRTGFSLKKLSLAICDTIKFQLSLGIRPERSNTGENVVQDSATADDSRCSEVRYLVHEDDRLDVKTRLDCIAKILCFFQNTGPT